MSQYGQVRLPNGEKGHQFESNSIKLKRDTRKRIDQLHVSNGILIDFIIKRDVTFGSPSCQRKCIAVYGELPIVEFEIPAVPQLKRTLRVRKKIGVVQSFPQLIAVV